MWQQKMAQIFYCVQKYLPYGTNTDAGFAVLRRQMRDLNNLSNLALALTLISSTTQLCFYTFGNYLVEELSQCNHRTSIEVSGVFFFS